MRSKSDFKAADYFLAFTYALFLVRPVTFNRRERILSQPKKHYMCYDSSFYF